MKSMDNAIRAEVLSRLERDYGLQHMKRWAAYLSHILTGVIAIGALALILMPHYAPEIAPRTNLPFCAVVLLTSMACLVSGHLAIRSKGATR